MDCCHKFQAASPFACLLWLALFAERLSSIFASGLSLHCVNQNNWRDWHWAPGTESSHAPAISLALKDVDEQLASAYDRGVWVFGTHTLNTYFHLLLKTTKDGQPFYFATEGEALSFCTALRRICTDAFGPQYSHIGAGTDYYVGVAYMSEGESIEFSSCPNYNDPGFPNSSGKPLIYPAVLRRFQKLQAQHKANSNYRLHHRSRG